MNVERFIRLDRGVTVDEHGDRVGGISRSEVQRASIQNIVVIAGRRRTILSGEINLRTQRGAAGLGNREYETGRAGIAFQMRHVIDRKRRRRIVVRDRQHRCIRRAKRRATCRCAQCQIDGFVTFEHHVTRDRDIEGLGARVAVLPV